MNFLSIEHYVPHRGAMLLLHSLLHADHAGAQARVVVPRDGLFLQDAGMPTWVGLEYMAQTIAAWAGWRAVQAGEPVKLGFLLGTRKFETDGDFFSPDTHLTVQVQCELEGANGLAMFACTIHSEERVRASARLSVYQPEDGMAYVHAQKMHTTQTQEWQLKT